MRKIPYTTLLAAMSVVLACVGLRADDWPAWRGPNRDGLCREKGLSKEWPKGGPRLLWKTTGLGIGHSTPSVVGNVLYLMGGKDNQDWVLALDVSRRGKVLWERSIGPSRNKGGGYPGPRATPTVDGNRLYATSLAGDMVCMDIRGKGRIVWRRDFVKDFGGKPPQWGYAESVLIDGPWALCTPGGPKNTIVALNKNNGQLVWGSPAGERAEYASIVPITVGRSKQYVNLMKGCVLGVAAKDGKPLWRYNAPVSRVANCSTCVVSGDTVFAASGYGVGGGLVKIEPADGGFRAAQVYFTKKMQNHHGGMVLADGYLYGSCNVNGLTCLDFKTGEAKWSSRTPGKGSVLWADGMLFFRAEDGPITLVEATPEGFRLKGRFDQPDRSDKNSWPYLVIANGVMYVRDQDVLLAYDVRGK